MATTQGGDRDTTGGTVLVGVGIAGAIAGAILWSRRRKPPTNGNGNGNGGANLVASSAAGQPSIT